MTSPTKGAFSAPPPDYVEDESSPNKAFTPAQTLTILNPTANSSYTSPSLVEPSYQPSRSSRSSVLQDIPDLPHSDRPLNPFSPKRGLSPERQSPTRPWTPTRGSIDLKRPAASTPSYEPASLNGSPRPSTFIRPADIYKRVDEEREKQRASTESARQSTDAPESDFTKSEFQPQDASPQPKLATESPGRMKSLFRRVVKKQNEVTFGDLPTSAAAEDVVDDGPIRPLPPAPLFAGGRPMSIASRHTDTEDASIAIKDDDEVNDEDDVFAPSFDDKRPQLESKASFASDSTFTDSIYPKPDFEQYAPAPEGKQLRRGARLAQMAKKEVRLINGELILECKIPTILYSFLPYKNNIEFTHMRYTAVTCDPDEFVPRGYKLRQNIGKGRETELLICVTMYNEDEIHFTRTMHAVMKNISHFCSRSKSRTWGEDGWEKIVVCIISDGRQKVHPRTLDALAAMGVYQDGIAKNSVNSREVSAHVYEYTTQVSLDPDLKFKGREKGIMPCQLIFCLKEKNQKKLNSHRWLFNAFGKALNPNVCILLDVGTKPGDTSLYHLWKAFDQDSNVAGAAGEIRAAKGKAWLGLLNPLVASQNFEYKMSNILDKPIESVFGYITVLPGALSAYRYYALQNDETGHGPLSQYFKGEKLHGSGADVFTANMYLAEDRILCWELVAKKSERWVLKYVNSAIGETDVPNSVPEFISQRRRWLNGAFFAAVYSLLHFRQIWLTDHTVARKILLHIEFVYQFVSLMFTFFSLANFYLTFYFIAGSLSDPSVDPFGHGVGAVIFVILRYACILLICMQFIISMGNRPQGAKKMYVFSMWFYSVIMVYTIFAALYIVIRQLAPGGGASGATVDLRIRDVHDNGNAGGNGNANTPSPNPGSAHSGNSPLDSSSNSPQNQTQNNFTLGNNIFTNLIVSTFSTIGLYFIMSFLYFDPWHMFTSAAQYFALLPSYICTLQVYAFCNAHDVTWGTKGDNVIHNDLGAAVAGGKGNTVEVEMPSEQLDIDSCYDGALRNLRDKIEVPPPPISESQAHEDYYRAVRTYVVVVWLSANSILAMAVSEAYGGKDVSENFYLKFILWSVAVLALFRAIGSTTFRVISLVQLVAEGRLKVDMKMTASNWGLLGTGSAGGSSVGSGLNLGSSSAATWLSEKMSRVGASSAGSSIGKT